MSLRVGQRVRTIDGREGIIDHVCDGILGDGTYNYFPGACHLEGMPRADWYFAYQLTPLDEGKVIEGVIARMGKAWGEWEGRWLCGACGARYGDGDAHNCLKPPLYICSKAGECKHTGCFSARPHEWRSGCEAMCYKGATCIPYVPEDEGREWFCALRSSDTCAHGSKGLTGRLMTAAEAKQWVVDFPGYRAFKWSDGLKGAPCE